MSARGWALVTGAGRRIGRALALTAAQAGYDVIVHAHASSEDAAHTANHVAALGRHCRVAQADLASEGEIAGLVAEGPVTLLVNSASVFADDSVKTLTAESLDTHYRVNLRAPVLLSQAFAAVLPADRDGLIVNIIDQRVWRLTPQYFSYTLAKAALWTATQTLAQALAPRIRVNAIGPGPTLKSVYQSEADFEAERSAVPLGYGATPEEIGQALAYLIDAHAVTGQMIAVDGGQHLAWNTPDVTYE